MNLYLRLLWTLLRAWRQPRIGMGDTLERSFRVLPNDLDINGHMNNGRYLTMVDLMLVEYFVRSGFFAAAWQRGWRPMSGGAVISYRRGLQPFARYQLRFRLEACDAHWNFMRFGFFDGERLHASGYMKGAAVGRQGLVPNAESYAAMGLSPPTQQPPAAVRDWLAAEQALISAAW